MKNIRLQTAGAGSGKTFFLTQELIEAIRRGVKVEEIVLVTFTKAAASEFIAKATKALLKASDKATNSVEKGRFKEAALQIGAAKIGTIDSICQQYVEQYAHLLQIAPRLTVIGEAEQNVYINQSLDSSVNATDLKVFDDLQKQFKISIYDQGQTITDGFWKVHLKKIIEYSDCYGIVDYSDSIKQSKALIDSLFDQKNDWKALEDFLNADGKKKLKCTKNDPVWKPKDCTQKVRDAIDSYLSSKSFADLRKVQKEMTDEAEGKSFAKKGDTSSGESAAMLDSWKPYVGASPSAFASYLRDVQFGKMLKDYEDLIFTVATDWRNNYKSYKTANNLIDYSDMEQLFLQLIINNPQVLDEIKLVMQDECQDMNALQIEIFDRLSEIVANHGGNSIWVGDRKQSIYGFRGSDMQLFDALFKMFPATGQPKNADGLESGTLGDSYRSRKKLVDAAGVIFNPVLPGAGLNAKRIFQGGDDLPETPALVDWQMSANKKEEWMKGIVQKVKAILDQNDTYIKQVVGVYDFDENGNYDESKRKLREVMPGDIAILANSNEDADGIATQLSQLGIPVNAADYKLTEYAEVQLMLAILSYCNSHSDYDKAIVLHLMQGKPTATIIDECVNGSGLVDTDSLLPKIDAVYKEAKAMSLYDLTQSLIAHLDLWRIVSSWGMAARRQAHLSTFCSMVQNYEQHAQLLGQAASIPGLLGYAKMKGAVPNTPFKKRDDAVSVLTYHKSKGLEWPIVILTSLDKHPLDPVSLIDGSLEGVLHFPTNNNKVDRAGRNEYITVLPSLKSSGKMPEGHEDALSKHVKANTDIYNKVKDERTRLMYVGFTRAKDYVVTVNNGAGYQWLEDIGVYDKDTVWKGIQPEEIVHEVVAPAETATSEVKPTSPAAPVDPTESETATEKDKTPKYVHPSELPSMSAQAQAPVAVGSPLSVDVSGSPMAKLGTCIHNIFAAFDDKASDNEENIQMAQHLLDHNNLTVVAQATNVIASVRALYQYLEQEYGAYTEIHKEMGILYRNERGQIVQGEIDLVWINETNCVIIDYKNKQSEDGKLPHATAHAAQLNAYREALDKALPNGRQVDHLVVFYPLQAQMVEISIGD